MAGNKELKVDSCNPRHLPSRIIFVRAAMPGVQGLLAFVSTISTRMASRELVRDSAEVTEDRAQVFYFHFDIAKARACFGKEKSS